MIRDLFADFRFALRGLFRERIFALTAIGALAAGIGTVTTTFSVVDADLWKPLPYRDADRLVYAYSKGPDSQARWDAFSGADLLDWRAGATSFSQIAGTGRTARRVLHLQTAQSVVVHEVTANYFVTLGRDAIQGRTFSNNDSRGAIGPTVLTDRGWKRLFDSDPSVVGREMKLDDQSIQIAGVVPTDDSMGTAPDLYLAMDESSAGFLDRAATPINGIIGRLQQGATVESARAQLQAVEMRLATTYATPRARHTVFLEDLSAFYSGFNGGTLYFFLGASLIVLLLSIVNVVGLLLNRAIGRAREFAVRGALGGRVSALSRQLLAEGALIVAPATALGVGVAAAALQGLATVLPDDFLARGAAIPIDVRVVAFAFLVSAATIATFVLTPLMAARRFDLAAILTGARSGASRSQGRTRGALLVAQIGLTVVLLSATGLLLRSFVELTRAPLGFDASSTISVRGTLSGARYKSDEQIRGYANEVLSRGRAVAGVDEAAIASSSPLGSGPVIRIVATGRPRNENARPPSSMIRAVSPSYFETLRIPLLQGRAFEDTDDVGAPQVAIVNATLAAKLFPGESAVGKRVEMVQRRGPAWTNRAGTFEIVGVAANAKELQVNEVSFGNLYLPYAQAPSPTVELIARASVPAASLMTMLRDRVATLDPSIPVTSVTTFESRVSRALQRDRFNLLLSSSFAAVALLLATLGIYGAVAYSVQSRTREFGIRIAVGAEPRRLVGTALGSALRFGAAGGVFGLTMTWIVARLIGDALYLVPGAHEGILYGVRTTDPLTLTSVFVGTLLIAAMAGAAPARRVARIDPVHALRVD